MHALLATWHNDHIFNCIGAFQTSERVIVFTRVSGHGSDFVRTASVSSGVFPFSEESERTLRREVLAIANIWRKRRLSAHAKTRLARIRNSFDSSVDENALVSPCYLRFCTVVERAAGVTNEAN